MLMLTSELIVRDMEVLAMSLLKFLRAIFSFLKLKKSSITHFSYCFFFISGLIKPHPHSPNNDPDFLHFKLP